MADLEALGWGNFQRHPLGYSEPFAKPQNLPLILKESPLSLELMCPLRLLQA